MHSKHCFASVVECNYKAQRCEFTQLISSIEAHTSHVWCNLALIVSEFQVGLLLLL